MPDGVFRHRLLPFVQVLHRVKRFQYGLDDGFPNLFYIFIRAEFWRRLYPIVVGEQLCSLFAQPTDFVFQHSLANAPIGLAGIVTHGKGSLRRARRG